MQYILNEEEFRTLSNKKDDRFDKLVTILHSIDDQVMTDKQKLKLFRELSNGITNASIGGFVDAELNAWENRNGEL